MSSVMFHPKARCPHLRITSVEKLVQAEAKVLIVVPGFTSILVGAGAGAVSFSGPCVAKVMQAVSTPPDVHGKVGSIAEKGFSHATGLVQDCVIVSHVRTCPAQCLVPAKLVEVKAHRWGGVKGHQRGGLGVARGAWRDWTR